MKTSLHVLLVLVWSLIASPYGLFGQTRQSTSVAHGDQTLAAMNERNSVHSTKNKAQINVDCSNPQAKVKTITDGLNLLGDERPALLLISGTCHENVVIQSLDRITLQGNPTATIDGGSDPSVGTVEIGDSQSIELNNLTITGGGEGVGCFGQSLCQLIQVTVQNVLGDGVGVGTRCHVQILDTVIQNNADVGMGIGAGSVNFFGGTISGNASDGIFVGDGGLVHLSSGNIYPSVTVQNNAGNGLFANSHVSVLLNPASITGNAGDGVSLQGSSEARIVQSAITGNLGHQVRIGDLSFVRFNIAPGNSVHGSNFPDVVCDPQFSTTRGIATLVGTTTNCPAELPPA